MYITQKEKEKLHMINKIFFVLSSRDSREGREKGRKGRWLVVGEGERERARMELGWLRME